MQTINKPVWLSAREDKKPTADSFKNSLRAWQARYKTQLAALTVVAGKPVRRSATASRLVGRFTTDRGPHGGGR